MEVNPSCCSFDPGISFYLIAFGSQAEGELSCTHPCLAHTRRVGKGQILSDPIIMCVGGDQYSVTVLYF